MRAIVLSTLGLVTVQVLLSALTCTVAVADGPESAPLPPPPLPGQAPPAASPEIVPEPEKEKVNTAGAGSMVNPQPTPERLVEAGPLEDKRINLLARIVNAKERGIGIDAYLNAFGALEHSVKDGESEANIQKRLDSIGSSLDDQIKRSQILKTQRPAPPVAASGFPPAGSGSGGSGGDMLEKLKSKYGGQIPDNLKEKFGSLPDSIKNQIPAGIGNMSPDQLKELAKQFRK